MNSITRLLVWSAMVLALGLAGVRSASALSISPPNLEYNLDPGQTVSQQIKLFNDESQPITVYSSVANFTAQGETGDPTWDFKAEPTDLASWIKVLGDSFTINPKDSVEATVTFNVPANAEPGGHYASIFFGPQPTGAAGDKQVNIKWMISALAIVRISGDVREQASIAEFGLNKSGSTLNRLPVDFFLRVNNSGNVHIRPTGSVTIRNMFGGTSTILVVNDKKGAVLPDTIRRFGDKDKGDAISWTKSDTPAATGNFFVEIGREWKNFGLGSYTATADLTYGSNHEALSTEVKFTIFPWRLLLVVLIGVILIIFLLIIGIKGYNKSIISRAEHKTGMPGTEGKKNV